MPSARELLAEADALMRRNRARAIDTEIPELTEAVALLVRPPLPTVLAEVPELTDAVEEIEIASIAEMPGDRDESVSWLHFDPDHTSVLLHAPGPIAGVTEPQCIVERDAHNAEPSFSLATPANETPVDPAAADTWARWEALGDEIRMQVLQRIDLYTDTGMRELLGAQLQPIIDRAGAEMVAKVNEHIGLLLRTHVAQAIEREIEKRRKDDV